MEPYAVFLDIDSTLMEDGIIPQRNIRAIREARKRGHKFFINTGRGFAHVPRRLKEEVGFDGYVCGLGSYVEVEGKAIHHVTIPAETWMRVGEIIFEEGTTGRLHGTDDVIYVGYTAENGTPVFSMEELEQHREFLCSKITIDGRPSEKAMEELRGYFRMYEFHHYVEGVTYGNDKATGMQLVLDAVGIPRERAVAVGDSANDEDMLRYAGIPVVMGDGDTEMQKLAKYVTCPCLEGGVGDIVEDLMLK